MPRDISPLAYCNEIRWFKMAFLTCLFSVIGIAMVPAQPVLPLQFKISSWTTDDGLPANSLVNLSQDKEGFLWIGSFDGVLRFDGTRFVTYNKTNFLTTNFARVVASDREGNVWIGTGNGLLCYRNGKFINFADKDHTFFVESLFIDEDAQQIWVGTRGEGLYTFDKKNKTYTRIENAVSKDFINSILKDREGNVWVGGEKNGLTELKDGRWTNYRDAQGLTGQEIISLFIDNDNNIYAATTSGLFVKKTGANFTRHEKFQDERINAVKKDHRGFLWVGTTHGVYIQVARDTWQHISKKDGLSNNDIRDIYVDREGSVWLATYRGGLNQLRETKFTTFSSNEGLDVEAISGFCQTDKNTLLMGSTVGKVFRLRGRVIDEFPLKTPITQRVYNLVQDNRNHLWVVSYDGLLLVMPDGREKLFTDKDGLPTNQLRVIYQDKKGNYWIGTRNGGLISMTFDRYPDKPKFTPYRFDELDKLNSTFIMSIDEDKQGNLLISTNIGGMSIIPRNGEIRNYTKDDGLISNVTFSARADDDNVIWVTTSDALVRIENDKAFSYTSRDGLPQENAMDVIEDNLGYLWLPTQKGIIRVQKKQLNDYKNGKLPGIEWKLFDKNNDLTKAECTGTARVYKDDDGVLWFPMLDGLVSVNPATVTNSKQFPKVYIEKVLVDDKEMDAAQPISLPAGTQRVAIDYVALSLLYPNSARYRYRLENFDKAWIDAGTARQAVFTNPPPGAYTFMVAASNNDGLWNPQAATVPVNVEAHYYQTWWFYALMILVASLGVFTYIRLRTRAIRRRAQWLEHKVQIRTKMIAKQRDELMALNEELMSSQEQVMAQRDTLAEKNEEIARMNTNLEIIVAERTRVLEDQNQRLQEYAFINAHKLRAPLASILGLINLMRIDAITEEQKLLIEHLNKSAEDLDIVVRSVNRMLEKEELKSAEREAEKKED